MKKIILFDTTLRDGAQRENISFSLEDKLKIAKLLADFGIDYIEAGWPGSNPKDALFFAQVKKDKQLRNKIVAFCSTRRKNIRAENDANLLAILKSGVKTATMVGKTSVTQVEKVLKTTKAENLKMIADSVSFLTKKGIKVIFDAEHFFDGFKENKRYALTCLKTASKTGAINLSLCDTNGGSLPLEIGKIVKSIKNRLKTPLGIHTHNDSGLAVANTLVGVENGAILVQGTINGYGERTGNADLTTIIPNLQLKMNCRCIPKKKLIQLTKLSKTITEIANETPKNDQPFVGKSAFTHKGGIHASAIGRLKTAYEHVDPKLIGNKTRVLISELAGRANLQAKFKEWNISNVKEELILDLLNKIKNLEQQGYSFEGAEASLKLLYHKLKKTYQPKFIPLSYELKMNKKHSQLAKAEAKITIIVNGKKIIQTAQGNGPVNALDTALRKAVIPFYQYLKNVELIDYKVRIPNEHAGTAAFTRVLITSKNHKSYWTTVGVSTNIIEASWQALIDSLEYALL